MEILILGALDEEIAGIRAAMAGVQDVQAGAFGVACGELHGHKIYLCRCGVGKTNAAAATAAILTKYPTVSWVINTGVAGGIGGGLQRGNVALGTKTVHHDYDQTPDGLRKGQVQGFDSEYFEGDKEMLSLMEQALKEEEIEYRVGVIASGDQFIASDATAKRIGKEFNAIACDFESAPIAQVCALFSKPFLSMRAISDNGGDNAVMSFYEFLHIAAANNVRAIEHFCRLL